MSVDESAPCIGRYPEDEEGKPKGLRSAITETTLLGVEGKDDVNFFRALLGHLGLAHVQLVCLQGRHGLPKKLDAVRVTPGFNMVDSFGIAADAEEDAAATFQRICRALRQVGLPVPKHPLIPAGENPRVCVLILPPGARAGAIEDLCLQAVELDPATACVEAFFGCLRNQPMLPPASIAKARVQAFLASRPRAGMSLGVAALEGYWPWDSPAFEDVKGFLRQMAQQPLHQGQAPSA